MSSGQTSRAQPAKFDPCFSQNLSYATKTINNEMILSDRKSHCRVRRIYCQIDGPSKKRNE